MSALWVLPVVVLVAGAAGAAWLTRRLADDVAHLGREAATLRELVDAAEQVRSEVAAATERGRGVVDVRARVEAVRARSSGAMAPPGDR